MVPNEIATTLAHYIPIRLEEMDDVRLMNRIDTKYAFHFTSFMKVLEQLKEDYRVLEIDGNRVPSYESLYLDDSCFSFYHDHHNGRTNRYKVRFRNYVESNLFFLEIKHKQKGRTIKNRMRVASIPTELTEEQKFFLKKNMEVDLDLAPNLWNSFHRITLVNQVLKERVTLDFQLKFRWKEKIVSFDQLVIAELKQERINPLSPFYKQMKSSIIRPYRLSKYCIGALEIYGRDHLKHNNFKEKLTKLKSINAHV